MNKPVYTRSGELLEADIGDELVALDPNAGKCFGFNEAATSVWRSLEQPKSFDQLLEALLEEYEVGPDECSRDLGELLDALIGKGLIKKNGAVGNHTG